MELFALDFRVRGASTPLTCKKARDFSSPAGFKAGVLLHAVKGHICLPIVSEIPVNSQQAQLVGLIPQFVGQRHFAAVHHAAVKKGGERIDLISNCSAAGAGRS